MNAKITTSDLLVMAICVMPLNIAIFGLYREDAIVQHDYIRIINIMIFTFIIIACFYKQLRNTTFYPVSLILAVILNVYWILFL